MSELESPIPRRERRAYRRPLPLPAMKIVPAGNPSLPTFVALMLMITTFMIVLTSISLHENTRLEELLSGVKQAFARAGGALEATDARKEGTLLQKAARGFRAALPMSESAGESGGSSLILTLPVAAALDTTRRQLTAEMERGIEALAASLADLPAETGYEIELRFADEAVSAEFAGVLAQAAVGRGIAPRHLFIGNASGDKEHLHLLVKLVPIAGDFVEQLPPAGQAGERP